MTALATVDPVAAFPAIGELAQRRARKYAEKALAPSTLRAYRADMDAFEDWCWGKGYCPLPAAPQVLADYVPEMHEVPSPRRLLRGQVDLSTNDPGGLRANSIRRRLAAIRYWHKRAGYPSPTDHPLVEEIIAGVLRTKVEECGETVRRVDPIMAEELRAILAPLGRSPRDVRDRALLLVNFRGALRRSELAALRRSDVTIHADALLVRVRKSKTDKLGAGAVVPIARPASEDSYDPGAALEAWLAIAPAGDGESPLFCSLHGAAIGKPFAPAAIATIIQRRAERAEISGDFSGHSLRRGVIQSLNAEGVTSVDIQMLTRQRTATMVTLYCENNDQRKLARRLRDGL